MTEIKHTGFFSADFEFDPQAKAELQRRGIRDEIVTAIEFHLDYLIALYGTNPPTKSIQHQNFGAAAKALANALASLDHFDDLTLDTLEAAVFRPKGHISPADLRSALRSYSAAAATLELRSKLKPGPDSSKLDHVALLIGQTLRDANVPLDDSLKGPFAILTQLSFDAMKIKAPDPRGCLQRALKKLATSNC